MPITLTATQSGAQETKNVYNGSKVKTARVHTGNSNNEKLIPDKYVDVVIAVFFDGTLNSRKNSQARVAHEKKEKGEILTSEEKEAASKFIPAGDKDTSYYNDESNVSRSEPYYDKEPEGKLLKASVYIEGIGTDDYEEDSSLGYGLGMGSTGVIAKVLKGCEKAVEQIKEVSKRKKINRLYIDTFGFSRGAAAARNFVHEVTKKKGSVKNVIPAGQGQPVIIYYDVDYGALGEHLGESFIEKMRLPLCVRYVGLFDTVASYGVAHFNDTSDLHLNAVSKALTTLQLAAADEHRDNFRLTNINSAGSRGTEKFLPGVHSDIGGGYIDGASEEVILEQNNVGWFGLESKKEEFIEQGWYNDDEIEVGWSSLIGTRKSISNKYSHIPLQIMVEFAQKKKVKFKVDNLKRKYPIIPDLKITKEKLSKYVLEDGDALTYENNPDLIKALRHKYFHFSAHYGNSALILEPMAPHKNILGKRVRVIQNG